MIPFKKINLGNAYEEIKPLFESGLIGLGDKVTELEKKLADYVGARHVVALNSCTSALFLCAKWEKGKEGVRKVSIPSMTFTLALDAILQAGLKVEFDDRTDWVGKYYQMTGSGIVDSAHELRRGQFREMKDAGYPDNLKLCFSFYPTKTVGGADGGAIATDDDRFAEWARSAAVYGRSKSEKQQNSWDYDVNMIGYKLHMTNLQAVIILEQLNRLDHTNAKRQVISAAYDLAFNLTNDSDYLYRIKVFNRDRFIEKMLAAGIECGVHFRPLHTFAPFGHIPMKKEDKITVEQAFAETVSLPLYDLLSSGEVEYIVEQVKETGDLI